MKCLNKTVLVLSMIISGEASAQFIVIGADTLPVVMEHRLYGEGYHTFNLPKFWEMIMVCVDTTVTQEIDTLPESIKFKFLIQPSPLPVIVYEVYYGDGKIPWIDYWMDFVWIKQRKTVIEGR
jgi:hypothetical protein